MTAHVLVTGTLFRPPKQRTSNAGKPFVTATLKAKDDDGQFWNVIAFADTPVAELMRLHEGESLSVQGAFKAELYDKDGVTKLLLSIVADHVLALRQPGRQRARGKDKPTLARREPAFNDGIPW
jgi:single-stranded DNA-binding protein